MKAKEVAVCASKRSVLNDRQLMVQRCFCFLGIGNRKGWFQAVWFSLDVGSTLWQRCSTSLLLNSFEDEESPVARVLEDSQIHRMSSKLIQLLAWIAHEYGGRGG